MHHLPTLQVRSRSDDSCFDTNERSCLIGRRFSKAVSVFDFLSCGNEHQLVSSRQQKHLIVMICSIILVMTGRRTSRHCITNGRPELGPWSLILGLDLEIKSLHDYVQSFSGSNESKRIGQWSGLWNR